MSLSLFLPSRLVDLLLTVALFLLSLVPFRESAKGHNYDFSKQTFIGEVRRPCCFHTLQGSASDTN